MFKKVIVLFLVIAFSMVSCEDLTLTNNQEKSDYYYLSTDHIIIAPILYRDTQYIEYTLDSLHIHKSTEMPFVLELDADTLSLGYHIVEARQYRMPSVGVTNSKSIIDFTIL